MYHATVLEVSDPGTSVFTLSATDRDEGLNAELHYELVESESDPESRWFEVHDKTGLITTRAHIDCETNASPRLRVRATDGGVPPLSGTTDVRIAIRAINDNRPSFEKRFYEVAVREDIRVGTCFLKVRQRAIGLVLLRTGDRSVQEGLQFEI